MRLSPRRSVVLLLGLGAALGRRVRAGQARHVARRRRSAREGGLQVGLKTYHATIPLADHEVILTFDDGPDAEYTPADPRRARRRNACARPSSLIGAKVEALPDSARREVAEGHTSRTTPSPIRSRRCATCATRRRAPTF